MRKKRELRDGKRSEIHELEVPCVFGNRQENVKLYIGNPDHKHTPTHFQETLIKVERGGLIPKEISDGLQSIRNLAKENGVSFLELCGYAIKSLSVVKNKPNDKKES
ncbi:DUF2610 domain-containing protein [Candidatus Cyrtobacter comes]|nr:DUF2610 domain-containing protein [Candidatus Cyrtobacter comes]